MYAVSLIGLLLAVFEFGIVILSTKKISEAPEKSHSFIQSAFALRLISYLITLLTLYLAFTFTNWIKYQVIVFTLLIYGFSNSLTLFYRSVFRGMEKLKYEGISIIIDRMLVIVISGTTLLLFGDDLSAFIWSYSVAFFLSMCVSYVLFTRLTGVSLPVADMKHILTTVVRPGSVFAIMNIMLILRTTIPTLFLETFQSSEQAGFYNSGYRLLESYLILPQIFVTPIYPYLVRLFRRRIILNRLLLNTTRIIFQLTTFLVIPILLFRNEFTLFLYGPDYIEASQTIAILVGGLYFIAGTVIFGSLVSATDLQPLANRFIFIEVLLSIVIYYIITNNYGATGVAWAKLCFDFLMTSLLFYSARGLLRTSAFLALFLRFTAIILTTYALFYILTVVIGIQSFWILLPFVSLLSVILSFAFGTIRREDLLVAISFVRRLKPTR